MKYLLILCLLSTSVLAKESEVYSDNYNNQEDRFWVSDYIQGIEYYIMLDTLTGCKYIVSGTGHNKTMSPLMKSNGTPDCTGDGAVLE